MKLARKSPCRSTSAIHWASLTWCQLLPNTGDSVGQPLFLAPQGHTACQGCSTIPAGKRHGSCPRRDGVCILPPLDHQQPHHFHVFARVRTGLGWITGVTLPSLLPPDL